MQIDRSSQIWCADIIFIPVKRGFLYLVAIMGESGLIHHSDHGVQYVSVKYTERLANRSYLSGFLGPLQTP